MGHRGSSMRYVGSFELLCKLVVALGLRSCGMCRVKKLGKVRFGKRRIPGPFQEQITFNEARRGSSQISELLR